MVWTSDILPITVTTSLSIIQDVYIVDASGGDITLTLPDITTDGMQYKLKRTDSTRANTVTIEGFAPAQTIDGEVSITLSVRSAIEVQSINTVWVSLFKSGIRKIPIYFSNGGSNINSGAYYGQGNVASAYGKVEVLVPAAGTITAMYSTKDSGTGKSGTSTLYVNNVASALAVSLGDGGGVTGSATGAVSVAQFDRLSIRNEGHSGSWSFGASTIMFEQD